MASNTVTRFDALNVEDVVFSSMKKNKNGGKTVYINGKNKQKMYIQFPFMRCPFGLSSFTDENTHKTSHSIDLSFDDNDNSNQLKDKLNKLDEIIINTVVENSVEWLGKKYNIEVIREALYKPIVRPGKGDYPSTIKIKVMTNADGEFQPEAYNMQKELISLEDLEKGSKCMCIVDINQIWFIDNKFGVSIRLSQVLIEGNTKLKSFAFTGISDQESDDDESVEVDE